MVGMGLLYYYYVLLSTLCSTIEHLLPLFLIQLKDEVSSAE